LLSPVHKLIEYYTTPTRIRSSAVLPQSDAGSACLPLFIVAIISV